MTLQHDLSVKCIDKLDSYDYDLYYKGRKVKTINSEDSYQWAIVTVDQDKVSDVMLVESAGQISKYVYDDSNIHVISIN